jgi:nucleoside-diphosphate-sugar epimerase
MKIAITGHTAGIGHALSRILQNRGHEIVGLSKRDGHNIRIIPRMVQTIEPCDMFINNAQSGYAQTELLYAVWQKWKAQPKHIWCISSMMGQMPIDPPIEGHAPESISAYRNQKVALEDACHQLQFRSFAPYITIIRPGAVATQPDQKFPWPHANVYAWANNLIEVMINADMTNLRVAEISLAPSPVRLGL